jgi:hypothetical protein
VEGTTLTISTTMTTKKTSEGGESKLLQLASRVCNLVAMFIMMTTHCVCLLTHPVKPPGDGANTLGICQGATRGQRIVQHGGKGADEADKCWGPGSCWRRGGLWGGIGKDSMEGGRGVTTVINY